LVVPGEDEEEALEVAAVFIGELLEEELDTGGGDELAIEEGGFPLLKVAFPCFAKVG